MSWEVGRPFSPGLFSVGESSRSRFALRSSPRPAVAKDLARVAVTAQK